MKIAFITFEYPPFVQGGAGVYSKNLTNELARLGHEIHIIVPKISGNELHSSNNGIFIHKINFINKTLLRAPSYWISLRRQFKTIEKHAGGFDIVHVNGVCDICITKKMLTTPRIITVHHLARDALEAINPTFFTRIKDFGGELGIGQYLDKKYIERAKQIIAVSEYTKRRIVMCYNVPPHKIEVIHNGWEKKNFKFSREDIDIIKDKYNIDKDKPVLLFVGRIDDKRKGLDLLFNAFKITLSKIDANLVVVGSGNQELFKHLLFSLGIDKNVVFTDYVDNQTLRIFYLMCDVYVIPSRLEGFGLTILDAMAAGKPIVATKVGAIPEILRDKENGILVDLNDIEGMSNAMCTFLQDRTLAKNIGERNKSYVKENFSWEKNAKETEKVYYQLADV